MSDLTDFEADLLAAMHEDGPEASPSPKDVVFGTFVKDLVCSDLDRNTVARVIREDLETGRQIAVGDRAPH